jgi:hypothetical protein
MHFTQQALFRRWGFSLSRLSGSSWNGRFGVKPLNRKPSLPQTFYRFSSRPRLGNFFARAATRCFRSDSATTRFTAACDLLRSVTLGSKDRT